MIERRHNREPGRRGPDSRTHETDLQMITIDYRVLPGEWNWSRDVERLIEQRGAVSVADLGAGAHPVLSPAEVERLGLEYTIFDISARELEKAAPAYTKVVADVDGQTFTDGNSYDLVVSRWLLEHLSSPPRFHRNVYEMLKPGCSAIHFFPTLYSTPFLINWLLPETVSSRVLGASFQDRSKFPARYSWCRGPTKRQLRRLEATGFSVDEYVGYYGHPYYGRFRPLAVAERRLRAYLGRHPSPLLTSFASVTLTRP